MTFVGPIWASRPTGIAEQLPLPSDPRIDLLNSGFWILDSLRIPSPLSPDSCLLTPFPLTAPLQRPPSPDVRRNKAAAASRANNRPSRRYLRCALQEPQNWSNQSFFAPQVPPRSTGYAGYGDRPHRDCVLPRRDPRSPVQRFSPGCP